MIFQTSQLAGAVYHFVFPAEGTNIADDVGDELQEVYVPPESNLEDFGKKCCTWLWLGMVGKKLKVIFTFHGESLIIYRFFLQ